ncbi:MAG: T9SS type A sorting domain-containing protein [Chitinophagales bacterium]
MNIKYYTFGWLLMFCSTAFAQTSYLDPLFTEYFRRTQGWTAGDATISIPLPDGKTMWLFGDSYIDNYQVTDNSLPCLFQVRNSLMVQEADDPNDMTTYIDYSKTGIERTYFKIGTVGNSVFWPGHGFVKNDTVFVFLEKYNSTTYAFQGNYIARILLPTFQLLTIKALPAMNGLNMGKAVIYDEPSGYYYIYGNKLNWIVFEPFVARAKFKNLQKGNWDFYTGSGWSKNATTAKKISNDPVCASFSVVKLNNSYRLITQENGYLTCGLGRNIYSYQSATPMGKFKTKKTLYTIEDQINGNYLLTYNAYAHPQFTANNELLISYNVNDGTDTVPPNACPAQCKNVFTDRMNADSYRPKFIRVPFSLMGLKSAEAVIQSVPVSLFPNPASDKITLSFYADCDQVCNIRIINKMGMVTREIVKSPVVKGSNQVELDISGLSPDLYVVDIESQTVNSLVKWERMKFIKQ